MHDDPVPGREAGQNLGDAFIPLTYPDRDRPGAPILNGENCGCQRLTCGESRAYRRQIF